MLKNEMPIKSPNSPPRATKTSVGLFKYDRFSGMKPVSFIEIVNSIGLKR